MTPNRTLGMLACSVVLLAGCGGGGGGGGEIAGAELLEIPEVPLERVGPDVARALEGRLDALRALVAAPASEPERLGRAFGSTGMLLHAHDLFDQADACYRNARTLMPGEFRWAYYLGRLHGATGRADTAVELLEQALVLRPADVPTRIALAQLQIEAGRHAEGERLLREALDRDPTSAIAYFYLGQAATARGDQATAVAEFTRTLDLQPGATRVHLPLSYAYRALGDEHRADRHLALRGDGALEVEDRWMQEVRGLVRGRQPLLEAGAKAFARGDFETAASEFSNVVAQQPDNAPAWLNLGASLFKLRRAAEAKTAFERALSIDENLPLAHRNLGTLLAAEGKLEPAIEHYRKALDASPSDVTTHFNLANALRRAKRYPEAVAGFRKVIELDPANSTAHLGVAICGVRQEEYRTALNDLETAMTMFPDDLMLANAAARLLAAAPVDGLRDGSRALAIARRIVREKRLLPFLETLAMAHAELGEFDEALEAQQAALDVVVTAGRDDLLSSLRDSMEAYRQGRPCRKPWPDE